MPEHITNRSGVTRAQDFRGNVLPEGLVQHLLGERVGDVLHACPECGIAVPRPFCQVCLGAGKVTADRLDRYQFEALRQA